MHLLHKRAFCCMCPITHYGLGCSVIQPSLSIIGLRKCQGNAEAQDMDLIPNVLPSLASPKMGS